MLVCPHNKKPNDARIEQGKKDSSCISCKNPQSYRLIFIIYVSQKTLYIDRSPKACKRPREEPNVLFRLEKVVVNMGIGSSWRVDKVILFSRSTSTLITGQNQYSKVTQGYL